MALHKVEYRLKSTDRESIRKELINLFLKEEPGNGSGELASKYEYCVEKVDDYQIILCRPARLNKGFDFVVKVESYYFQLPTGRRHKEPSHNDICHFLKEYKSSYPQEFKALSKIIEKIYRCDSVDILKETQLMSSLVNQDRSRCTTAMICYCIKWLFIEQDITYWNFSGRMMLWNHIQGLF